MEHRPRSHSPLLQSGHPNDVGPGFASGYSDHSDRHTVSLDRPSYRFQDSLNQSAGPSTYGPVPSSSSGTKRKRGRGRKSTSCIACNRRKQKCNSELPCLNCKTRGVAESCAYKTSVSPPPVAIPTTVTGSHRESYSHNERYYPTPHPHPLHALMQRPPNVTPSGDYHSRPSQASGPGPGLGQSYSTRFPHPQHPGPLLSRSQPEQYLARFSESHRVEYPPDTAYAPSPQGRSPSGGHEYARPLLPPRALSTQMSTSPALHASKPISTGNRAGHTIPSPSFQRPRGTFNEIDRPILPPPNPSFSHNLPSPVNLGLPTLLGDVRRNSPRQASSSSLESEASGFPSLGHLWNPHDNGRSSLTLPKLRMSNELGSAGGNRDGGSDSLSKIREEGDFVSSHFGPQGVAEPVFKHGAQLQAPENDSRLDRLDELRPPRPFRDEPGGGNQLWELLSLLPRKRSTSDQLVRAYFDHYNYHADVVYWPDFSRKYTTFWTTTFHPDALCQVDMRWLALLFVMLAYGILMDMSRDATASERREIQESSWTWYWACRRCILLASSSYGESMDIVRAGILVTRYLVHHRRVPEAWMAIGSCCRTSEAQGYHIDGARWKLSHEESELRRRLFSQLVALDRVISLALGRPVAIRNQQCLAEAPHNQLDSEISAPAPTTSRPLSEPTKTTYLMLRRDLSKILGDLHDFCFGLDPPAYDVVVELDTALSNWAAALPLHYRLEEPSTALDDSCQWLKPHRLSLHSEFYFAQITLHRPHLLRSSVADAFKRSRDVCVAAACADLALRMSLDDAHPIDAFQLSTGPLGFHSCTVLGVIAVDDPLGPHTARILEYLETYVHDIESSPRLDRNMQQEINVINMCINKTRMQMRKAQSQAASVAVPEGSHRAEPSPSLSPTLSMKDMAGSSNVTGDTASEAAKSPAPTFQALITAAEGAAPEIGASRVHTPPLLFSTGLGTAGPSGRFAAPWEVISDGSFLILPEAGNMTGWAALLDRLAEHAGVPA